MVKVELLLPAGSIDGLRAAVHNGADAVYLGLSRFNARRSADNFHKDNIFEAVEFCHGKNVKVYVALNTLVKNSEIEDYLKQVEIAKQAGADAVIIQDQCLVGVLKKNFPHLDIHLSTQATVVNKYSIPSGVDRVILARELELDEMVEISKEHETEVFVHGALCLSYSGQCLFSSMAANRSGNRGTCSQPCRRKYNNKYPLSTKDMCLLPELPAVIGTGVSSLKIEGRMRSTLYAATTARIYRKAIDSYYAGEFSYSKQDVKDLMLAFNREFTTGFAFNDSIVDARKPMNRGLYLGNVDADGKVKLREPLRVGDGIGIWTAKGVIGHEITWIRLDRKDVKSACPGDVVSMEIKGAKEKDPVYKTSSVEMVAKLGEDIPTKYKRFQTKKLDVPSFSPSKPNTPPQIFARAHSMKEALEAGRSGADVVYYDILKKDALDVKTQLKKAKFFLATPKILSSQQVAGTYDTLVALEHDGVLVGERGMLNYLIEKGYKKEIHLDYSFNTFNDVDIACDSGIPIISPELTFEEITNLQDKNIIVPVHGDIVLMNTKEPIKAPELVDSQGMHFKVRKRGDISEVLNSKQLGLFTLSKKYADHGIRYFYIDVQKELDKYVRIYRKILSGKSFDDNKIKKGNTTGHFNKEV